MSKRRKLVWLVLGAISILSIGSYVAIRSRHSSRFEFLYSLNPQVGQYSAAVAALTTTGGSVTIQSSIPGQGMVRYYAGPGSSTTAPSNQTVLVFPSADSDRVIQYLGKSGRFTFETPKFGLDNTMWIGSDGKEALTFATGQFAKDIADRAHLSLPSGGFVVTFSEPPDWFTIKLNAVLHFLRLR